MTNKSQILRKVLLGFYILFPVLILMRIVFVYNIMSTIEFILICILICIWVIIPLILCIFALSINKFFLHKMYNTYIDCFHELEYIHKERYKLYFIEIRNDSLIKERSTQIEKLGNELILTRDFILSNYKLNPAQKQNVEEILQKTKTLMNTTFPLD